MGIYGNWGSATYVSHPVWRYWLCVNGVRKWKSICVYIQPAEHLLYVHFMHACCVFRNDSSFCKGCSRIGVALCIHEWCPVYRQVKKKRIWYFDAWRFGSRNRYTEMSRWHPTLSQICTQALYSGNFLLDVNKKRNNCPKSRNIVSCSPSVYVTDLWQCTKQCFFFSTLVASHVFISVSSLIDALVEETISETFRWWTKLQYNFSKRILW